MIYIYILNKQQEKLKQTTIILTQNTARNAPQLRQSVPQTQCYVQYVYTADAFKYLNTESSVTQIQAKRVLRNIH